MSRQRTAAVLWLLLGLFILRVAGQALVGLGIASFLPPWNEWYSGLLPYPWLFASQLLIIAVFGKICVDLTRGSGFFARPHQRASLPLMVFGGIYIAGMITRYLILRTHGIPILFHLVLAGFITVLGAYYHEGRGQRAQGKETQREEGKSKGWGKRQT